VDDDQLPGPSRLIARQQLGCGSPSRLILEIDISKLLAGVVAHDETCRCFLGRTRAGGSGVLCDHFVGADDERLRKGETERFGRLEI
jgi:hypothetical protein